MQYIKWVKDKGAELDKVTLKYFTPSYRGLIANRDIKNGEEIITIPRSAIITLAMAKKGVVGAKIVEHKLDLIYPNNSTLATYVLTEMLNPKSDWVNLYQAFPKSVSNFPLFFTPAELKYFEGSHFISTSSMLILSRRSPHAKGGHAEGLQQDSRQGAGLQEALLR
jgi:hypothetical protein